MKNTLNAACGDQNFDKMKAMEHPTSPLSSLIWLWLLVSLGKPLVTFLTALSESRSDYRKELSVLGLVVIHHLDTLRPR